MTSHFQVIFAGDTTEIRLRGRNDPLPVEDWAAQAPPEAQRGVAILQALAAAEQVVLADNAALVEPKAIAGLSSTEAEALSLPPPAAVIADIRSEGLVARGTFAVRLIWTRANGQPVLGARREGAWLIIGGQRSRLLDPLFSIAEAVDQITEVAADEGARYQAIADLQEILPHGARDRVSKASGAIDSIKIAVAGSFSLEVDGDGDTLRLIPVVHAGTVQAVNPEDDGSITSELAEEATETPALLSLAQQEAFGRDQFHRFGTARNVYTLPGGLFLVPTPQLHKALSIVRQTQQEPVARRRALLREPRAFLHDARADDTDATCMDQLFRETPAWSERVIGLGLWVRRVLPWLPRVGNEWFGDPPPTAEAAADALWSHAAVGPA